MKKTTLILSTCLVAICLLVACNARRATIATTDWASIFPTALYDEGVVINGVRWATRNIDAPGTFAEFPTSTGMFFNRGVWAISNESRRPFPIPSRTIPAGCPVGPCPEGWRLPTEQELQSLIDAGSITASVSGIRGRLFGEAPYQIFLPAAGIVEGGTLLFNGIRGYYWGWQGRAGSTTFTQKNLLFCTDSDAIRMWGEAAGSIRCVHDN